LIFRFSKTCKNKWTFLSSGSLPSARKHSRSSRQRSLNLELNFNKAESHSLITEPTAPRFSSHRYEIDNKNTYLNLFWQFFELFFSVHYFLILKIAKSFTIITISMIIKRAKMLTENLFSDLHINQTEELFFYWMNLYNRLSTVK